ncbi:chain length determinant protein EpsF [Rhizobacter sp. OV335]|uniref:chain length determinant protein EpsF n=1 Tax=Rhizobacter sp. OV335 TaxID=1500264 RepID=UPI0009228FC9|nr:chain length determinant protein EpsF [Rhizobacter sp. OV335]SHM98320.1 chain length determinant protein EpsF [Rhizobacter sp. OV335]
MSFSQFMSILRARWKAALAMLLFTLGTALALSLLLPKKYTASAALVIDVKSPDPIAGMVLAGMMTPGYMSTQVDIITSDRVAQRVVRDMKLNQNAESRAKWLDATDGAGEFEAWLAEALQKHLDVKPSRESNVLNVSYTSPDPKFSAALANAFVQAYIDTNLDLRVDPAKQYSSFFDTRAKELRESLEKAQARLSTYQKDKGLVSTDERFDVENAKLNELSTQLITLQALSAESTSRQQQAALSPNQLPDVINNPVVGGLRADLSRQEAQLQQLSTRLGDANPQVLELKANINELRSRYDAEVRRVSSSMGVNNNINKAREADVRNALEAQRSKVLKLKDQRDESQVLQRDLEAAQRAYDAVGARLTQTSLESQNNQTNISVLTRASVPARHSSPRLLLNMLVAVFLGGMLAVGIALLRELIDRRVRSPEDLVRTIGLPVIGSIPQPIRKRLLGGKQRFVLPHRVLARLPGASSKLAVANGTRGR